MADVQGFSNEPKLPGVKEPKSPRPARRMQKALGSTSPAPPLPPSIAAPPARASATAWASDVSPARAVTPLPPDANVTRPQAASESSLDWLAHVPLFALIAGLPFFAVVYGIRKLTAVRRGAPVNKAGAIAALVAGGAVILGVIGVVAAVVLDPTESRDPTDLAVGDCVTDVGLTDDAPEEVSSVRVIDCAKPHFGQVYYESVLPTGPYPGTSALSSRLDEACWAEVDAIFLRDSEPDGYVQLLFPTRDGWYQGDRTFRCLVVTESEIGYARSLLVP